MATKFLCLDSKCQLTSKLMIHAQDVIQHLGHQPFQKLEDIQGILKDQSSIVINFMAKHQQDQVIQGVEEEFNAIQEQFNSLLQSLIQTIKNQIANVFKTHTRYGEIIQILLTAEDEKISKLEDDLSFIMDKEKLIKQSSAITSTIEEINTNLKNIASNIQSALLTSSTQSQIKQKQSSTRDFQIQTDEVYIMPYQQPPMQPNPAQQISPSTPQQIVPQVSSRSIQGLQGIKSLSPIQPQVKKSEIQAQQAPQQQPSQQQAQQQQALQQQLMFPPQNSLVYYYDQADVNDMKQSVAKSSQAQMSVAQAEQYSQRGMQPSAPYQQINPGKISQAENKVFGKMSMAAYPSQSTPVEKSRSLQVMRQVPIEPRQDQNMQIIEEEQKIFTHGTQSQAQKRYKETQQQYDESGSDDEHLFQAIDESIHLREEPIPKYVKNIEFVHSNRKINYWDPIQKVERQKIVSLLQDQFNFIFTENNKLSVTQNAEAIHKSYLKILMEVLLEFQPHILEMDLHGLNIVDLGFLSPIKELQYITELRIDLFNNQIVSIKPLGEIRFLANLTRLELYLHVNQINNIQPLADFQILRKLNYLIIYLNQNQIPNKKLKLNSLKKFQQYFNR